MNIRYRTLSTAVCCTLLFTACSYDKKRIVTPNNSTMTQSQGLETSESVPSKVIVQPAPLGVSSEQHYVTDEDGYPGVINGPQVLPDMQYIKDRIFEYGRKLNRWKELDEQAVIAELDEAASEEMVRCFRDLQKVLNGYNRIQDALLRQDFMDSTQMITGSEVMDLEQRDISFLESGCGQLLKGGADEGAGWAQREKKADLPQIETLIERYAGSEIGRASCRERVLRLV